MNFRELLDALVRRWYVLVAGTVITAALAFLVTTAVPATYTSTASLLLLPPRSAIGPRGNPYMNLSGMAPAMDVLTVQVLASSNVRDLARQNPKATLIVEPDTSTNGPILLITASDDSSANSERLRDALVAEVAPTLGSMQEKFATPESSRITVTTLAADPKPERDIKDLLRALIVVGALGGAATLFGAGMLDRVLSARKNAAGRPARPRTKRPRLRAGGSKMPDRQPSWGWDITEPPREDRPRQKSTVAANQGPVDVTGSRN